MGKFRMLFDCHEWVHIEVFSFTGNGFNWVVVITF